MMIRFVVLLLIAISFFLPTVFAHSETQVVEMTPDGFKPQTVTVDENSSVIFVNKDTKPRWPASNIHPTHEIYPEFDPKKPIQKGDSWSFKPTKSGEWKYHDHLFPHMRGKITVVSEDGQVQTPSWQQTIKDFLGQLISKIKSIFPLQKNDAQKSWEDLKQTYQGEAGSSGNIHDQAHLAGSMIFKQKGFEGIALCSPEFAFGCFHGFLDKAFAKNLDRLLDAQNACLKLGPENSGPVASCIHGIGHGVASFHQTTDLKASLASCRKLTSGREYCFDGVFMEFVRSAPLSFFKKDDPLYPCNNLEKEFGPAYSFSCGRNQPSLLMSRFDKGFDEVVDICRSSQSKLFKEACFDSLGFSLASTGNVEKIIAGCQKIEDAQFLGRCIKAAAGELVFQEVPNWQEDSVAVCNGFPEGFSECMSHVNRLIEEYGRLKKINFVPIKKGEDLGSYIRKQMKVCFDTDGEGGCYKQVAAILYNQFGLSQTLQLFKANENYPEVYARCHEVTHYLSRSEYEKQDSIAKVYAQCDSTCHGGCYHGTLEAYLKQQNDQASSSLNSKFAKVCGNAADYQKPLEFNECLHGLGHAAMFVTEMELIQSLALCDSLLEQPRKERCYTGVFMENSSSSTSFDHASIYIKKEDPFYPCNSLEEKYQSLCWQYQSSYFSMINNQDWVKVAQMCLQIPDQYQDRCFRTIGTNQVGFTSSLNTMKKDCDLMPSAHFQDICVGGVVSSLSYRFVGEAQKMIDFCLLVNPQNKETCFKQIGNGVLDWDKNKDIAKKECGKIPESQGVSWCMSVI